MAGPCRNKAYLKLRYTIAVMMLLAPGLSIAQTKKWTLKECISEALEKNIPLGQSEIADEINKVNYIQSKNNISPNLNFTDGHSLYYGRSVNPVTGLYVKQNSSDNNPALTSTVTLYNGRKNFNLIKENKLAYDAGQLDIEQMKNNIALSVIADYLQVLYEYEAVKVAQYQANATSEQEEYTKRHVAAGNKPLSSLYQIEAQLAANRASVTAAENQLQLAKVALMQVMQMRITNDFDIEQPDDADVTPTPVLQSSIEIYNIAEGILPDVKSAKIKTEASMAALRVTKSETLPKLTLSGSLYSSYSNLNKQLHTTEGTQNIGFLKDNPSEAVVSSVPVTTTSDYPFFNQISDNFGQSLALNLTVPIFNNLQYKNDMEKAKLAIRSAQLNESLTKNILRQAIEQAYTDQVTSCRNYLSTTQQLAYEEKYYNDIQKQSRQGMATMTDYTVAQNNYYGAQVSNVQAKYEYLFKTKVLAFYTGELIR